MIRIRRMRFKSHPVKNDSNKKAVRKKKDRPRFDDERSELSVRHRKEDFKVLMWWFNNSDKHGKIFRDKNGWKRIIKDRVE